MDHAQKIQELRKIMEKEGCDAFLVPYADEYQGEYPSEASKRLKWLTGFTGSAGMAVITQNVAMVMSDSRYTIQLEKEVDTSIYQLENSQIVKLGQWISDHVPKGVIGYDSKLHTSQQIDMLVKSGLALKSLDSNLIDQIWLDRPSEPIEKVRLFPIEYAGQSTTDKIEQIQSDLKGNNIDYCLLTLPDSIAWLLNIRGKDIPFIPIALSHAIIPVSGAVQWYVAQAKITDEVIQSLQDKVIFKAPEDLVPDIQFMAGKAIAIDKKRSSKWFETLAMNAGALVVDLDDPCILPRACKNVSECVSMKNAHVRDGVAIVKFLKWLEENLESEQLTELSIELELEKFRKEAEEFIEPSFNTIAGYADNGAIVHYRALEETNKTLKKGNLLLLDSGAQYVDGTTDITRTVAIGKPTQDMVKHNTLVLKGHIAVASAVFPPDTTGKEIDILARQFLQQEGLDYAHGTGHGVGCHLSVHEESTSISPRENKTFEEGMIVSNEPGYYEQGQYGIRIESLVLVGKAENDCFSFETITLAPLDKSLMDVKSLTNQEIEWINQYHQKVFDILAPVLDVDHQAWLQEKTANM